jgi:hypothetical protein
MLPKFSIDDIRNFSPRPCYDPNRYLQEDWTGTALDILAVQACPAVDRLWVVLREECVSSRTLRLFAVRCARQALALVTDPDPRSVAACDTAERFANSEATAEELAAAGAAARAAARAAAWAVGDAAGDAAWAAAWAAADAAGDAGDAAWAAARAAAWAAARAAARAAADAAGDAAGDAAWAAARAAARAAQIECLREMLTA